MAWRTRSLRLLLEARRQGELALAQVMERVLVPIRHFRPRPLIDRLPGFQPQGRGDFLGASEI